MYNDGLEKGFGMKKLITQTGWTKEDWKEKVYDLFCLGSVLGAGFILPGLIG